MQICVSVGILKQILHIYQCKICQMQKDSNEHLIVSCPYILYFESYHEINKIQVTCIFIFLLKLSPIIFMCPSSMILRKENALLKTMYQIR